MNKEKDYTLILGDLHGEYEVFLKLLSAVDKEFALSKTRLIVQELTDRGLDTKRLISEVLQLKKQGYSVDLLASNHDWDFSQLKFHDLASGKSGLFDYPDFQVPIEHIEFLSQASLFIETSHSIFVHAGIRKGVRNLEQAEPNDFIRKTGAKDFLTPKSIYMGHSIRSKIEQHNNQIFVDTGAYLFNYHHLSGVLLDSEKGEIVKKIRLKNPIPEGHDLYKSRLNCKLLNFKAWEASSEEIFQNLKQSLIIKN